MVTPANPLELIDGRIATPAERLPGLLEDPDDGSALGPQRASAPKAVELALAAADRAWEDGGWSGLPVDARAAALERLADGLAARAEELALLDALDSGVPLAITRAIAGSLAGTLRAAAAEARAAGEARPLEAGGRRVEVLRLPWGPALLLTPWNAPAAAAASKLANALAAGCPAILKPSELAPSFSRPLAEAAVEAELPPGALQIVHGGPEVAQRLLGDRRVRVVALTGGQATGRAVAAATAARMVPLQLELGGTNAALVTDDADLGAAAEALAAGMTKLNGQWCEAPRRILVAAARHDELVSALEAALAGRTVGSLRNEATDVGPLAHRDHLARVRAQVAALGGEALTPSPAPEGDGFHLSPAIVVGAPPAAAGEEIFGPVVTVHPVADDHEAVRLANANGDGLAGYVFAGDRERAFALGRRLHAGEVRIGGTNLVDLAPGSTQSFWGTSGLGAHGARQVLEAFRGSRIVGEEDPSLPL
ncbi:aldehyde dehydrogenase family protein [Conexibacter arvalis]|uniref:Phenylacetaldehyde dehydrogenase n=1 Tax=Conexibacter arvalis TaxID=912552 RepID=A0A840I6W6_9ACTN|nr:phenylacetaldehyde dehydrogenase [Conexibacter arvalis]